MGFEEAKAVADIAIGVVDTCYKFGEMIQSIDQCLIMKEKTKLMKRKTELMREKIRLQNLEYLKERRKHVSEFEKIQDEFRIQLEEELQKTAKQPVQKIKKERKITINFGW